MVAEVSTTVECNGPLDVNVSVSAQVMLDVSKLKAVIPCVPAKIGGGFKIGGSGKANLKCGATTRANLKDKLLHGRVSGLLGASGGGTIHGGGFALCNDKVVGADGEIRGSARILGKSVFKSDVGVGNDGKGVLCGDKRLTGAGEYSGGATVSAATDEDALAYVQAYGRPITVVKGTQEVAQLVTGNESNQLNSTDN